MCGIAAIFRYDPSASEIDPAALLRVRDAMTSRGPDGAGEWYAPDRRVGLAHRRLSIIDPSTAGAQPMLDEEQTVVVTFNGEIYNYQVLRRMLEEKGHRFRSQSDTEVLLHLYREKGEQMVHELRSASPCGTARANAFSRADPFGIKPLYYADDGKVFASRLRSRRCWRRRINTSPDPAGHVGYFVGPHPRTVHTFPGHSAASGGRFHVVDADGARTPHVFCSVKDILLDAENRALQRRRAAGQIAQRNSFDSVRHHLIADVPVGVFLSSVLDSTTVAALAAEAGGQLNTVTLGFEEYRSTENDEVPLAELVARQYGAKHQTIWVRGQDFHEEGGALMHAMDQPTIDGVNTYFVSKVARQAGLTVALSGLGGDEIFAGYSSFEEIPSAVSRLSLFNSLPALAAASVVSLRPSSRFTSPMTPDSSNTAAGSPAPTCCGAGCSCPGTA
jgi:asparagine synthase (glutamine-hydrolysing)